MATWLHRPTDWYGRAGLAWEGRQAGSDGWAASTQLVQLDDGKEGRGRYCKLGWPDKGLRRAA
ncbi:hypothetical protein E2562_019236 [Oryza meyeriana var. granulata]|uniref:Uncharacterized protein n=1 Tax=Oryza meyeriana var. granulata TaxID=110450 RepID=A0A6G1FA16_9ORYZ|nr:hypothetical protein E2562_019236 [Oryza meyeriana var. granulata]